MKILLSPTKKQIINTNFKGTSTPLFNNKAQELMNELLNLGRDGIKDLLGISDKLANENWLRIKEWGDTKCSSSAAMFTFVGEVFSQLDPFSFKNNDIEYANSVLRIFSGLYGILKPMDIIQPYRLDIKDSLELPKYSSLYNYWKNDLTNYLIDEIERDDVKLIIDLSSKEYSKSIDFNKIPCDLVTPDFKTEADGKLKTIGMWSKRMRGILAREIILNRVEDMDRLKEIKLPGYRLEDSANGKYLYIKRMDKQ